MLSKCLNPLCSATFRYLRQGHLYRIDFSETRRRMALASGIKIDPTLGKAESVEHFWLCENCATTLTIELTGRGKVQLVPREIPARKPTVAERLPSRQQVATAV